MILEAILAVVITAGSPKCESPKYYEAWGPKRTAELVKACVNAGIERGYTADSVQKYCSCTVYVLEEVATPDEYEKLSSQGKAELGAQIGQGCRELGHGAVKKEAKEAPKVKPVPIFKSPNVLKI